MEEGIRNKFGDYLDECLQKVITPLKTASNVIKINSAI